MTLILFFALTFDTRVRLANPAPTVPTEHRTIHIEQTRIHPMPPAHSWGRR